METTENNITVRFYEELNDFLPTHLHKKDILLSFTGKRSVKDIIESTGVPHVEVDLILVNGKSVDFKYIIGDQDRISVYPVFERLSIKKISRLRDEPLRKPSFVLDVHLGKLTKRLRLLGFDSNYSRFRDDPELADISVRENRILLTRDIGLLKRKIITKGLFIRNTDPDRQIIEIVNKLDLRSLCSPFTRCISCNGLIEKLSYHNDIDIINSKVPGGVLSWCREFHRCQSCGNIYWEGSHMGRLEKIIKNIL
jgi:uncharacterized protein